MQAIFGSSRRKTVRVGEALTKSIKSRASAGGAMVEEVVEKEAKVVIVVAKGTKCL